MTPSTTKTNWLGLVLLGAAFLALGVLGGWGRFFVVLALVLCIALHEFGHFITAKRSGIKITQAFLFFGPTLWSFQKGETEYGVKAFPIGAFVRMVGMHNLDPVDPEDEPRTYRQQPFHRRLLVASAGSLMHFVIAIVLLVVLLLATGKPRADLWSIDQVVPNSAASAAGLQPGDRIVTVNGVDTKTFAEVVPFIKDHPGAHLDLVVLRSGQRVNYSVTVGSVDDTGVQRAFLGVSTKAGNEDISFFAAIPESARLFGRVTKSSVSALGSLVSPTKISRYFGELTGNRPVAGTPGGDPTDLRFSSPLGIGRVAGQAANEGFGRSLELIITINIFVGLFNLVPLLPLDGGHVVIAIYERLRSRKNKMYHADVAKMMPVAYATISVLALLFLSSVYLDIFHPIG